MKVLFLIVIVFCLFCVGRAIDTAPKAEQITQIRLEVACPALDSIDRRISAALALPVAVNNKDHESPLTHHCESRIVTLDRVAHRIIRSEPDHPTAEAYLTNEVFARIVATLEESDFFARAVDSDSNKAVEEETADRHGAAHSRGLHKELAVAWKNENGEHVVKTLHFNSEDASIHQIDVTITELVSQLVFYRAPRHASQILQLSVATVVAVSGYEYDVTRRITFSRSGEVLLEEKRWVPQETEHTTPKQRFGFLKPSAHAEFERIAHRVVDSELVMLDSSYGEPKKGSWGRITGIIWSVGPDETENKMTFSWGRRVAPERQRHFQWDMHRLAEHVQWTDERPVNWTIVYVGCSLIGVVLMIMAAAVCCAACQCCRRRKACPSDAEAKEPMLDKKEHEAI